MIHEEGRGISFYVVYLEDIVLKPCVFGECGMMYFLKTYIAVDSRS